MNARQNNRYSIFLCPECSTKRFATYNGSEAYYCPHEGTLMVVDPITGRCIGWNDVAVEEIEDILQGLTVTALVMVEMAKKKQMQQKN